MFPPRRMYSTSSSPTEHDQSTRNRRVVSQTNKTSNVENSDGTPSPNKNPISSFSSSSHPSDERDEVKKKAEFTKPSRKDDADSAGRDKAEAEAEEESDDEEGAVEHTHLRDVPFFNKYQPALEVTEREKLVKGLIYSRWSLPLDNIFQILSNVWLRRPMAAVAHAVYNRFFAENIHNATEHIVQQEISTDFVADDFLEGAREAVRAVIERVWSGDVAEDGPLREMLSEEALTISRLNIEHMRKLGFEPREAQITRFRRCQLVGLNLWGPASIRLVSPALIDKLYGVGAYDPLSRSDKASETDTVPEGQDEQQQRKEGATQSPGTGSFSTGPSPFSSAGSTTNSPGASSSSSSSTPSRPGARTVGLLDALPATAASRISDSWLVLSVALDLQIRVKIRALQPLSLGASKGASAASAADVSRDGGVGGANGDADQSKTGEDEGSVPEFTRYMDRRGTWLFCTGPLPSGCSRALHSKWFVLGWF